MNRCRQYVREHPLCEDYPKIKQSDLKHRGSLRQVQGQRYWRTSRRGGELSHRTPRYLRNSRDLAHRRSPVQEGRKLDIVNNYQRVGRICLF